jgi:predicted O-methyltransferase YrrM
MPSEVYFDKNVIDNFTEELQVYAGLPSISFLQIGAYTGDASKWFLTNVLTHLTSVLVDVDVWDDDVSVWPGKNRENEYDQRVASFPNVIKVKLSSKEFFSVNSRKFDVIYIDGGIWDAQTYLDGVMALNCLKHGGTLIFDDYLSDGNPGVRQASINSFTKRYEKLIVKKQLRNQMWIKMAHRPKSSSIRTMSSSPK